MRSFRALKVRGLSAPPLSLSFFIHGKPACSLLARVALLRSVLIRLRFFTLVFSRLRPHRALPRIYVAAPAFIGCRAYASESFCAFSGKVFCRTALCRFRVRLLTRSRLPRALYGLSYTARPLSLCTPAPSSAAPAFIGCRSAVCLTAFIGCRAYVSESFCAFFG